MTKETKDDSTQWQILKPTGEKESKEIGTQATIEKPDKRLLINEGAKAMIKKLLKE